MSHTTHSPSSLSQPVDEGAPLAGGNPRRDNPLHYNEAALPATSTTIICFASPVEAVDSPTAASPVSTTVTTTPASATTASPSFCQRLVSLTEFGGQPHTSWRRFVVLAVFCLFSLSNAMQWLTYSPIPTQIKQFYGINTVQLNMLSTVYMIVYIALAFVSCLGLERIGLRWCLLIGTGLNFIGSLLKLVIGFPSDTYIVILIAQVLNSLAQIFVLSVPPTLALVWFAEKDRGTATTVGAVANAFGCAIGMLVPPLWVKDGVDTAEGLQKLFGLQLGLCSVAFLGALCCVPSIAPSAAAADLPSAEEDEANAEALKPIHALRPPIKAAATVEEANSEKQTTSLANRSSHFLASPNPLTSPAGEAEGSVTLEAVSTHNLLSPPPMPPSTYDNPNEESHLYTPTEGGQRANNGGGVIITVNPTATEGPNHHQQQQSSTATAPSATSGGASTSSPTETATMQQQQQFAEPTGALEVLRALGRLVLDRDSLLCELGLSISIGSVWAVNTVLAQVLAPINVSESDAGQMGFWNIIAGTIVALVAGPIVDRYRVYKWPIVGLAGLNLVCLSVIIALIYTDDTAFGDAAKGSTVACIYAMNVIAGIPQNVVTPIGMEFLMELTYGHPGSISGGLLMALANAVSLIEVSVGSELLGSADVAPKANALKAFWLVWALLVVGFVLLIAPRNNLKRLAAQRKRDSVDSRNTRNPARDRGEEGTQPRIGPTSVEYIPVDDAELGALAIGAAALPAPTPSTATLPPSAESVTILANASLS